jgi:hypothetical protein
VHPNSLKHGQIVDAADHGLIQANRSLEISGSAPHEIRRVHDPPFPPRLAIVWDDGHIHRFDFYSSAKGRLCPTRFDNREILGGLSAEQGGG